MLKYCLIPYSLFFFCFFSLVLQQSLVESWHFCTWRMMWFKTAREKGQNLQKILHLLLRMHLNMLQGRFLIRFFFLFVCRLGPVYNIQQKDYFSVSYYTSSIFKLQHLFQKKVLTVTSYWYMPSKRLTPELGQRNKAFSQSSLLHYWLEGSFHTETPASGLKRVQSACETALCGRFGGAAFWFQWAGAL